MNTFLTAVKIAWACLPESRTRLTIAVKFFILPCILMLFFMSLSSRGGAFSLESAFAAAIGVSAIASSVAVVSIIATDRFEGVTVFLLGAHGNFVLSWLGRYAVVSGIGTVTALINFTVSLIITQQNIELRIIPLIALLAVLTPLTATGFGVCLGALSMWLKNSLTVANLAEFMLPLTIGMIAPVSVFPTTLQALSSALPITHTVTAGRYLAVGEISAFWHETVLSLAIGGIWLAFAVILWRVFVKRTRKTGNFESF